MEYNTIMPQKQEGRWESIMDLLEEALMFNESDAFLQDPNGTEIHKVVVQHDVENKYSITVNEISMGGDFDMGEGYKIIKSCIDSNEPSSTDDV